LDRGDASLAGAGLPAAHLAAGRVASAPQPARMRLCHARTVHAYGSAARSAHALRRAGDAGSDYAAGPGTNTSLKKCFGSRPRSSTQAFFTAATMGGAPQQYTS
ncbi:MAG: hypothetical protein JWQ13_3486, partial [Ramlibacter sp.]|nr:hypothetical protein [Ramlibacter sp.]